MKSSKILLIEDDSIHSSSFSNYANRSGLKCEVATNISEAKAFLKEYSFELVLLDLVLGHESSMDLISHISSEYPLSKVIVMSSVESNDLAVRALNRGAVSFISKSCSQRVIDIEIKKRNSKPIHRNKLNHEIFHELGFIGNCEIMKKLFDEIEQLKDIDTTVLISGESGTGKELVARALHKISNRSSQRFEAINCGAIPENLLESELFGYKKGAFTDAKSDKKGIFEVCSDGTLFLDEIGEMPIALQVKILRVLQEKEIKPIGSNQTFKINTRVIAATNKDLEEQVRLNKFREDLFFRISVFIIETPALRDKQEDIPFLVEFLIDKFNKIYNKSVNIPPKEIMVKLQTHSWQGNIRELQNSIERAVVFSKDNELHLDRLFNQKSSENTTTQQFSFNLNQLNYTDAKNSFEKEYLQELLTISNGNIAQASQIAGRFRSDVYRLMEKHHIDKGEFRSN